MLVFRRATSDDADALWKMLEPVIRAGETYPLPRDMTREETLAYWLSGEKTTFIAKEDGAPLGTYYLKANSTGGGAHVSNCGYITAVAARGRGVASQMCEHSQEQARQHGFLAMQFNFVISTNTGAVALWRHMGFEIIGTLPGAFDHPALGHVDAHIMFKTL